MGWEVDPPRPVSTGRTLRQAKGAGQDGSTSHVKGGRGKVIPRISLPAGGRAETAHDVN